MNAKKNNASQVAHHSVGQRYIHTVVIFIRKAFSFVMLSETYNLKIQTKKASSVLLVQVAKCLLHGSPTEFKRVVLAQVSKHDIM